MSTGCGRKACPCALLVGMQTGTGSMENSTQVSQKIKNRSTILSRNSTSGYIYKRNKTTISDVYLHHMFTAVLFTITKTDVFTDK